MSTAKPTPTTECPRCRGTGRLPDAKVTGREMRARREAAGLTMEEVGEAVVTADGDGWSRQYIWMLEEGHKPWSDETKAKFEAALAAATDKAARTAAVQAAKESS